ncbi:MAG: hypothetical protein OXU69_14700 [Gemmatimonadota bacterium]|nr:hypothetical protein [Gemmatimonadota bacterium]
MAKRLVFLVAPEVDEGRVPRNLRVAGQETVSSVEAAMTSGGS